MWSSARVHSWTSAVPHLYINDLPACLRFSTARMYADDTNITVSSKSTIRLHDELNHDLNTFEIGC